MLHEWFREKSGQPRLNANNKTKSPEFRPLHVELSPRDSLLKTSYALVEHCRSISLKRLSPDRLAQLTPDEITLVLDRLQRLLGR